DSRFEPFELFLDEGHRLYATMNKMLPELDTGIAHLGGEEIPFENLPLPEATKMKLREELPENTTVRLLNEPIIITRKNGSLTAKKLVTFHTNAAGDKVKFDVRQESDGSQRIIDLLPAFLEIAALKSKKVYVIDEVDRSLHTLLIRRLLESYLSKCTHE